MNTRPSMAREPLLYRKHVEALSIYSSVAKLSRGSDVSRNSAKIKQRSATGSGYANILGVLRRGSVRQKKSTIDHILCKLCSLDVQIWEGESIIIFFSEQVRTTKKASEDVADSDVLRDPCKTASPLYTSLIQLQTCRCN